MSWNSLGQPHVNGRLAMTRSIGDLDLKKNGVIAEPETKRIRVRSHWDMFVFLLCILVPHLFSPAIMLLGLIFSTKTEVGQVP